MLRRVIGTIDKTWDRRRKRPRRVSRLHYTYRRDLRQQVKLQNYSLADLVNVITLTSISL